MPVLFHLMDVGEPAKPVVEATKEPAAEIENSKGPELAAQGPRSGSTEAQLAALLAKAWASIPPPGTLVNEKKEAASPVLPSASESRANSSATSNKLSKPATTQPLVSASPTANTISTSSANVELSGPRPSSSHSNAIHRQKSKPTAGDDWFATHGKFIALGFVLALIGTIYVARNRRPATKPVLATASHVHPGEAGGAKKAKSAQPASVISVSQTSPGTTASTGTTEASPAKIAETADGSEARTQLHAPAIPQMASSTSSSPSANSKPSTSVASTDESLFPWAKKSQETVAARPSGPQLIVNPSVPAPNAARTTPQASAGNGISAPATATTAPVMGSRPPASPAPQQATFYPETSRPAAEAVAAGSPSGQSVAPPGGNRSKFVLPTDARPESSAAWVTPPPGTMQR
jgi:hypothetical protein